MYLYICIFKWLLCFALFLFVWKWWNMGAADDGKRLDNAQLHKTPTFLFAETPLPMLREKLLIKVFLAKHVFYVLFGLFIMYLFFFLSFYFFFLSNPIQPHELNNVLLQKAGPHLRVGLISWSTLTQLNSITSIWIV